MTQENTAHPVQLQVNTNGAWKLVLRFSGLYAHVKVMNATRLLSEVNPEANWRIVTCDPYPVVISHMDKSTGGIWMDSKGAV